MRTTTDMSGLVDFALVEFADDRRTGRAAEELLDLHDRGIIQIQHLLVLGKHRDGSVYAADLAEVLPDRTHGFANAKRARTDLLADPELREAATALTAGHLAVLVVYRVTWALPFEAVAHDSHGELLMSGRLPAADVLVAFTGGSGDAGA